jgi:hypothetical protein
MILATRSRVVLIASLVFVTCFAANSSAQSDPHIGVWKMNVAKSKFGSGPTPKSGITKIEAAGSGTKITVDQPLADGTTRHWEFAGAYDGKDSPITGNNPDGDMASRTRVDANTVRTVYKKAGKVTTTQTATVSSDGKTRTVTTTRTDAAGVKATNVVVFDRQ